jgi:hypothetical protein
MLFLGLLIFIFSSPFSQTPRETFEITEEMQFPAHAQVNLGDFQSPVTTYNGSIYFAWVDDQLRTRIAKKSAEGNITTNVIFEVTDEDPYHNEPSVGIDREGYIHVVGNMHHNEWRYKISDMPEDISTFTSAGSDSMRTIPGVSITYPFFTRDRQGVLYIAFRHRVKYGTGWSPGILSGGVARYDADSRQWTMLGGTDYEHGVKTLIWHPGGISAYQGYKVRIFFDVNNRMHVNWNAFTTEDNQGGFGATHVLYAYLDDGGDTFLRSDGSPYATLPIGIEDGDIVYQVNPGNLYNLTNVGATADGRPISSFLSNGAKWCILQPDNGWSEAAAFPASFPARFITDYNGVITAVSSGTFSRSFDEGQTWEEYDLGSGSTQSCIFDYSFLATTSQLRFQSQTGGTVTVYTALFSGSQAPPSSVIKWRNNRTHDLGLQPRIMGEGSYMFLLTNPLNAGVYDALGKRYPLYCF